MPPTFTSATPIGSEVGAVNLSVHPVEAKTATVVIQGVAPIGRPDRPIRLLIVDEER